MATLAHDRLKRLARLMLSEKGFSENEIFEEYRISQIKRDLVVDMAGVSEVNHLSVGIECGNTPAEKIPQLKLFFDEVIVLPYLAGLTQSGIDDIERRLTKIISSNADYAARIKQLEETAAQRFVELKQGLNEQIQEIERFRDEVESTKVTLKDMRLSQM